MTSGSKLQISARLLLLQLSSLHSFKELQPLTLLRTHPQVSFHLPTLSGVTT